MRCSLLLIVDSGESNQQCQRITHRNCQTHFNSVSPPIPDNGAAIPPKTNMLIPINADAVPDSCVPTALIASAPPTVPMPLQNAMVKNNATSAGMGNCIHAHKTVSNAHKIAAIRPPRNNVIALIRRARREKIHEAMISPMPLRPNTRLNCIGLKPNSFCNTNDEEPIYANKPASIKLESGKSA